MAGGRDRRNRERACGLPRKPDVPGAEYSPQPTKRPSRDYISENKEEPVPAKGLARPVPRPATAPARHAEYGRVPEYIMERRRAKVANRVVEGEQIAAIGRDAARELRRGDARRIKEEAKLRSQLADLRVEYNKVKHATEYHTSKLRRHKESLEAQIDRAEDDIARISKAAARRLGMLDNKVNGVDREVEEWVPEAWPPMC